MPVSRRRPAWLLCAVAVWATAAVAQAATSYRAVERKSTVRFKAETGIPFMPVVKGTLARYDVTATIDAANPPASRAEIVIHMDSIKSESAFVPDAKIREQLQTDRYPTATLRTTAVRATGQPSIYEVDVTLDVMGKTYRDTVRAEVVAFKGYLRFIGTYRKRTDSGKEAVLEFSLHAEPL
ncbi:MAG: YceI family protein [Elusimicrobia bacterium]|nr:YceI family protein [Elusimicrobiota bacterium]